jgi:hypothetical protein
LGFDFVGFIMVDDVEGEPLGGRALHIVVEAMKPYPLVHFDVCNVLHLEASKAALT